MRTGLDFIVSMLVPAEPLVAVRTKTGSPPGGGFQRAAAAFWTVKGQLVEIAAARRAITIRRTKKNCADAKNTDCNRSDGERQRSCQYANSDSRKREQHCRHREPRIRPDSLSHPSKLIA